MVIAQILETRSGLQLKPIDTLREPVKLAAGLDSDKKLDKESFVRGLDAIRRFGERLRSFPPSQVRVVATNTLRVARNAAQFIEQAQLALGFPIEVIAGREEARLIYLGAAHDAPACNDLRLVIDIGGGSTEFIIGRDYDAKMRRTASRPLPSGRMQPATAAIFGGACSVVGLVYLAALVNPLTSVVGAVTSVSYLFIYTPLKRVTWLNTLVGAIPGALPPLMGWTAARNELSGEGWALFAILAFWQIPHFMAIAWLYRDEYAKAGFIMLPNADAGGSRTAQQAVGNTLFLLLASVCPFAFGLNGKLYLGAALILGAGYCWCALRFAQQLTARRARQLFLASIIYLPLLIAALVGNKMK